MALPITTISELSSYLQSRCQPFKTVRILSGGYANFTFAVESPTGQLSIIKHAEQYLKTNSSFHVGTSRMDSEARALTLMNEILVPGGNLAEDPYIVKVPEIYSYDAENHVIHESYAGPQTLKAAYTDKHVDVQLWARKIASWLADLHSLTNEVDLGDVSWATDIYRIIYDGAPDVFQKYGLDRGVGERVNEIYGSLLQSERQNVCHGDFWCGNMILSEEGTIMTIGDWEMVRRGNGATDVGQFCAEAYLLDRFKGGRGMMSSFVRGYREKIPFEREFAVRVAVHCATHLSYWPMFVTSTDEEGLRKLVADAHEVLVMIENEDWDGLRGSFLGEVFVELDSQRPDTLMLSPLTV